MPPIPREWRNHDEEMTDELAELLDTVFLDSVPIVDGPTVRVGEQASDRPATGAFYPLSSLSGSPATASPRPSLLCRYPYAP